MPRPARREWVCFGAHRQGIAARGLGSFDLDNTLLAGDSDHLWGDYLVGLGVVDGARYRAENQRFYDAYRAGTLDIFEFLAFALQPLAAHPRERLEAWRERFVAESIDPIVLPAARALVDRHRRQGHRTAIITATNRFVTEPIARLFGVDALIATEPEEVDGVYTGRVAGVPCYREGKVTRLASGWPANRRPRPGSTAIRTTTCRFWERSIIRRGRSGSRAA